MIKSKITSELYELREQIIEQIQPTYRENQKIRESINFISGVIRKWNNEHENFPFDLILPQGSTGIKQTHLRGAFDIDLFIFLNPDIDLFIKYLNPANRELLGDLFKKLCNNWIIPALKSSDEFTNVILSYAEHPYVSAVYKNFDIDIVFAFLLSEDFLLNNGPITAVDRTFFHSKFINENLSENQRNDVRMLKKFFKSHLSYGDKAPIGCGGFIGYAAELMIYHFGDIFKLFENFESLPDIVIDFYGRTEAELRKIQRFKRDLLLIMDPTDKKRNVAASISPRSWIYCKYIIKKFLDNPDIELMINPILHKIDKDSQQINENYVVIEVKQNSDDHYTKIRDKLYSIAQNLKKIALYENNHSPRFTDVNYSIYFNTKNNIFAIAFYATNFNISSTFLRRGPKANKNSEHYKKFKTKHPDMFIKNNYCYIPQSREYTNFLNLIKTQVNKRLFKEIELMNISIPKNIITAEALNALSILKYSILPYEKELKKELLKKQISS
ncbi:MAG: hypothetical protein ACTSWY_07580 [Promethearchaeota archaeon]